jgi:PEP-CTERM motif
MIARSANGVVDVNFWPAAPGATPLNNPELYDLLANTLVPEPTTLGFVGAGFLALIVARRRRKIQS